MSDSHATPYRAVVADPPWQIAPGMGRGGRRANATRVPYSFMSLREIAALPVAELVDDDCTLYLWCTRKVFREGDGAKIADGVLSVKLPPYSYQMVRVKLG